MPKIDENTLKGHIKQRSFACVYYIYGAEAYLVHHYAERIKRSAVLAFEEFNLCEYEAGKVTCEKAVDACESLPMFNDYRCVCLNDFICDNDTFTEYLENPNPSTVLVFYYTGIEPPKTAAQKKLAAAAEKAGCVIEFKRKTEDELVKTICAGVGKRGCQMSAAAARYMVMNCGDDMYTLLSDVDKLCAYRPKGVIGENEIDLLCAKTLNANVFSMVGEIERGNLQKAMKILSDLFAARQDAIKIFSALASSYVRMYYAIIAKNSGKNLIEFGEKAGINNPKSLTYSTAGAVRLGEEKIVKSLNALSECDRLLKNTGSDARIAIEQTLVRLYDIGRAR